MKTKEYSFNTLGEVKRFVKSIPAEKYDQDRCSSLAKGSCGCLLHHNYHINKERIPLYPDLAERLRITMIEVRFIFGSIPMINCVKHEFDKSFKVDNTKTNFLKRLELVQARYNK